MKKLAKNYLKHSLNHKFKIGMPRMVVLKRIHNLNSLKLFFIELLMRFNFEWNTKRDVAWQVSGQLTIYAQCVVINYFFHKRKTINYPYTQTIVVTMCGKRHLTASALMFKLLKFSEFTFSLSLAFFTVILCCGSFIFVQWENITAYFHKD